MPLDTPVSTKDSLELVAIHATEQPRFQPVLSRYLMEVAAEADHDAAQKARRILNRHDYRCFWLNANGQDIGFAVVLLLPEGQAELADFTVFPQHRRCGWGRRAAEQLFARFPGNWRMGVSDTSPEAAAFWGTCLSLIKQVEDVKTGAPFSQCQSKSFCFSVKTDA